MGEKDVINVLRFPGGEQILFRNDRTKYLLLMPGDRLVSDIFSGVGVWNFQTMKMPFETYKKRYLVGEER